MDCGNFCVDWLKLQRGIKTLKFNQKYIFSDIFPGVSLLPKIGIQLLSLFDDVAIIHENKEYFVDIVNEELQLVEEYKKWMLQFKKQGGIYKNETINIDYLDSSLEKYFCIIPIKKGEGSHFVMLKHINEKVVVEDNKQGEIFYSKKEFEDLINLKNGKYCLLCK